MLDKLWQWKTCQACMDRSLSPSATRDSITEPILVCRVQEKSGSCPHWPKRGRPGLALNGQKAGTLRASDRKTPLWVGSQKGKRPDRLVARQEGEICAPQLPGSRPRLSAHPRCLHAPPGPRLTIRSQVIVSVAKRPKNNPCVRQMVQRDPGIGSICG